MKAETAYNVFQALSEKEKDRFLRMVFSEKSTSTLKHTNQKKPIITDAEATEYLLKKMKKKN